MSVLDANGLTVIRSGTAILQEAGLSLADGEIVGLIGPNGAGKTTLLRCLVNLINPDRGDVHLNGRPVTALARPEIAREVAYLAQNAGVHWPMSVDRIVGLGRLPHSSTFRGLGRRDWTVIERVLEETDIVHLRDRQALTLSGGERIRMLLASALAVEAPILLADEPISGLDPGHQLQIMQLLKDLARRGRSVVVVLHDLTLALRYCDRIVLMAGGQVVADDQAGGVLTEERLARVYGIEAQILGDGGSRIVVPIGPAQPPARPSEAPTGKRSA